MCLPSISHKCWNSFYWYSWCWLKLNPGCWLGPYLFVWLFSHFQNNSDIMSVVIFGWLVLIPSGESLAVLSNSNVWFRDVYISWSQVSLGPLLYVFMSVLLVVRVVQLPQTSWHDHVEFKYTFIVYICVGKYSWKHLSNAHWVNSEEWMQWWKL